jgi:UDP-N-acetylglucosamine--N-acetylmuramyl-(pentapeptide) pyrophosphoryl-undecaprenol N-acetylglucosamine transferase
MAKFLIAGGGTGGHIYPGFAVAEAVGEMDSLSRLDFASTERVIDENILKGWPGRVTPQPIQPFSMRPLGFLKFAIGMWKSKDQIKRWIKENGIEGVLGLGGFGSGAAMQVGSKLGLRTAFLNPDVVPGRANQWLTPYAEKIFVQWQDTQQYFLKPVDVVGVPLRKAIYALAGPERGKAKAEAYIQFGLDPHRKTLVIMGGSTGARSLNNAVVKVIKELAGRIGDSWQVLHIIGRGDFDQMAGAYDGFGKIMVKTIAYLDHMEQAWAMADAAICRAGAITLAELTAVGIPSILLPYPYHRDNHQAKNANVLVRAGAAVMVNDDKIAGEQTTCDLRTALERILLEESERLGMIDKTKTLQRLDAACVVARWLLGKK